VIEVTDQKVYLGSCDTYEVDRLEQLLWQGLEKLGGEPVVQPGQRVFLKVNLLMKRRPEEAVTTHPAVAEAAARVVKALGGIPVIGDSPGGPMTEQSLRASYRISGMEEAARRSGAELNLDLSVREVSCPDGVVSHSFRCLDAVCRADAVWSLCKLKTHGMLTFTGAVKNLYGVIPGLTKAEYHYRFPSKLPFCDMLVDLCSCIRPTLSIMDGVVAMEGDGPSGGTPRPMGVVLMARDPYVCDVAACDLIGFSREQVPLWLQAAQRGLSPEDAQGLLYVGEQPQRFRVTDFRRPSSMSITFVGGVPRWLRGPLFDLLSPKPSIVAEKCVGCGQCARACPAHTITVEGGRAVIHGEKCIKCYCCHELCPERAVRIRRGLLQKFIGQGGAG
jgi:uncharacterized protein (DUF362 family)/NAD-dependent dihydropyrimidine dehydrogenase PreA subunit